MKSKYPIKKITKLNFWLTLYCFLFAFVTTMASSGIAGLHMAVLYSLMGALTINLNAFANLTLLILLENRLTTKVINYKKKFFVLSFIINYPIYILVIIGHNYFLNYPLYFSSFIYVIIICILANTMVLAFQNYIIVQNAKTTLDLENAKLKAANTDAANQLLKQQIHPHFLFNALNILKSLYKTNPKSGEEYVIHLSNFLRASISNGNIKVISLKDELKLCVDYLEMQKIRFGNALAYTISIPKDTLNTGFVPSFSIQPLLENAIKHNELTEEYPQQIQICQYGDRIKVINKLKLKKTSQVSTGSGLANLSERYRLLSNDDLIIEDTKNTFSVSIKILRHEDSNN